MNDDLDHSLPPRRAVVVGAGIVGLSTAWHLLRRGVEVVVVDRGRVAAGASWGNAGWLSPGLVAPLPDPAVLRHGLRALVDPSSAIYVRPTIDPAVWTFLARFALHSTSSQWKRAAASYTAIARGALDAYDELADGGVSVPAIEAPIVAAFARPSDTEPLVHELRLLADAGLPLQVSELDGDAARTLAPHLSDRIVSAIRIDGQRYVDPGAYVGSLADAVVAAGGTIRTGVEVTSLRRTARAVQVLAAGHDALQGDVVVVATGAWLGRLLPRSSGIPSVRAGRGYSMTVDVETVPACPVYLPLARVACTPYRGALRVGGAMEVAAPGAPLDARRLGAIADSVRPLLDGVDWGSRRDDWVGPRPITADGLPLVGPTGDPGVFVAGGHGMWGMTLGPATGKLLAEAVLTGECPPALLGFDPLRRLRPLRQRRRRPRPAPRAYKR